MRAKKDRERFSIKFNENDPAHRNVIDILEQQGPRQKAQFIANAILHYIHCPETLDTRITQTVDVAFIEKIVLEILKEQGMGEINVGSGQVVSNPVIRNMGEPKKVSKDLETRILDDEMMEMIAHTMSAFRSK
ncbi:hypothetical protein [Lachnoclostridium edouardi]|uniref:hypothetical protein n=1 Tax=Lachnoclostridium edouardi TaxID=1926283 RepID=UPI000C7E2907|nr:hypothetical protein [Lachnoclostridium edouardi]